MRHFVKRSNKGGSVCTYNQSFKTKNCSDILNPISRELIVEKNFYDIIEAYMSYKKDLSKSF